MGATRRMQNTFVDEEPVMVRLSNLFMLNESVIRILLCGGLFYTMFYLNGFTRMVHESQWHLYSFPYSEEQLPVLDTALICGLTFLFVCAMSVALNKYLFKENSRYIKLDLLFFALGFSLCVMTTLLLVEIIKNMVGRLRPSFLEYCVGSDYSDWLTETKIPKYSVTDSINFEADTDFTFECPNTCYSGECTPEAPVIEEEADLINYNNQVQYMCNIIQHRVFFPRIPDCARIFNWMEREATAYNAKYFPEDAGETEVGEFAAVLFPRDEHHLADMRKSFPSGHSATTFASFLYMGLYAGWFFSIRQGYWRNTMWFTLMVMFLAFPICCAITRSMDYRHHAEDIVAGIIIGSGIAILTFSMYYNLGEVADAPMSDVLLKYVCQPGNFTDAAYGVEFEGEGKDGGNYYYTQDDVNVQAHRGSEGRTTSSEDSDCYMPTT